MDSASSASDMIGSVIFLTMTALPDSEAATSLVLMPRASKSRRIASATAAPSMIAPSTILSGGNVSVPKPVTLKVLPDALSSTAFTALEPMSRPTRALALRNTSHPRQHANGFIGTSCSASEVPWASCLQNRQNCAKVRSAEAPRRYENQPEVQFCNLDNDPNCRYPLGLPSFER